jgi:hypothetical protein
LTILVVVDGDGDGDDSSTELRRHGHDARDKLHRSSVPRFIEHPQHAKAVHDGCAFHRRSSRDRVVPRSIGVAASSGGLGDVQRHRQSRPSKLVRQMRQSAWEFDGRSEGQELDRTAIDVEALKAEHAPPSPAARASCWESVAVAVAVAVAVNVNV